MLNIVLLLVSALLIPFIVVAALGTYKPVDGGKKVLKGLAIALLGSGLLRFFYSASLYENGFLPAKELPFSYLSILMVFALFAVFNSGKSGTVLKKIFILTALVPVVFSLFNSRIYLNPDDTHLVTTALYFVEVGLVISLGTIFLWKENLAIKWGDLLFATLTFLLYIGIATGLNFGWQLEIPFDLNFYLGYALALVSIFIVYLLSFLKRRLVSKNISKKAEINKVE